MTEFDGTEYVLLIIDDLMNEVNESVAKIFTKRSHHRNISVILLVQNLFHKNKHVRTISLNSHYLVRYKNPRDASQIANLFRQMYPSNWRFAVEAYKDATRKPYRYLLVDLRPEQDEDLRLRTNVFSGETHYVYVPKNEQAPRRVNSTLLQSLHCASVPMMSRQQSMSVTLVYISTVTCR